MTKEKQNRILFYAFNSIGFTIPKEHLRIDNDTLVEFVDFEMPCDFAEYSMVVLPSGVFEKINIHNNWNGTYADVKVKENTLLEKERQALNLIRSGNSIVFLVDKIVDEVPFGSYETKKINATDLCKRLLNAFNIPRQLVSSSAFVMPKHDEFKQYIEKFGVAKTAFDLYGLDKDEYNTIATSGNSIVGVEVSNRIYALPFHTDQMGSDILNTLVTLVVKAVLEFKHKMREVVPSWLQEFVFPEEKILNDKMEALLADLEQIDKEKLKWQSYKSILICKGELLKSRVVQILDNFFGYAVDPIDEGREDAKVVESDGTVLFMVEIKGTNKGVKREHINQVDSHRERNGIDSTTPGLLIINNEMTVAGIDERSQTMVTDEQVIHAKRMNVTIIRTIDLLFLMHQITDHQDKKKVLNNFLKCGGGWLKCTNTEMKVIQGEKCP
jgi:hypothetical protein